MPSRCASPLVRDFASISSTTTRPPTRPTRANPRAACSGGRALATRWETSGSRWSRCGKRTAQCSRTPCDRHERERYRAGYELRVAVDSGDVEARARLGIGLVQEGRHAEALPHLGAAVVKRPGRLGPQLQPGGSTRRARPLRRSSPTLRRRATRRPRRLAHAQCAGRRAARRRRPQPRDRALQKGGRVAAGRRRSTKQPRRRRCSEQAISPAPRRPMGRRCGSTPGTPWPSSTTPDSCRSAVAIGRPSRCSRRCSSRSPIGSRRTSTSPVPWLASTASTTRSSTCAALSSYGRGRGDPLSARADAGEARTTAGSDRGARDGSPLSARSRAGETGPRAASGTQRPGRGTGLLKRRSVCYVRRRYR